ncbi:MAG: prenyltransferase/squalene oxidase repeat-containing protein [Phycisphaerales bacterium]|nr:terpene cyclase/mutase family protein [Phycisphaerales bacterium]
MRTATRLIPAACAALVCAAAFAQPADEPEAPPATPPAPANEHKTAENNAAENEITPELNACVSKGLAWLAAQQAPDGSFGGSRYPKHVGITALACLAFMSDGNLPGRGEYGEQVRKGLDFVLKSVNETGFVAGESTSHGPMYGHGFATLFLGEVYGMTQGGADTALSKRLHDAVTRACRLIELSQNDEGGWRYNPVPMDADISVTICQIMALRSARNAGIEVPVETIDRAVEYVRLCQNDDGGFRYQSMRGQSAFPRSAAGVASLFYAGVYEDEAIDRGVRYLKSQRNEGGRAISAHYFYGHYYAAQAMYLAGGDEWGQWWPSVRDEMIERQRDEGSWDDPNAGQEYGTAMALIVLQMPKRYLPIFQK